MVVTDRQTDLFREPGSQAAQLYERARQVLPGGNTRTTVYQSPHPPYAASGHGAYVVDAEGQERLDCINNYTSLIHGHVDPDINAAVIDQLQRGTAFAMPTEHEVALAELLVERVPSVERIRFTNSGSEAVMVALKAARAYTGRPKIAKFEGCYHGSYDYAEVSLASHAGNWGDEEPVSTAYSHGTPQGVLDDVVVLRFNDADLAERLITRHKDELAAVLIDPMPLRAGMVPAELPFLTRLRQLCDAYGIVLIFDEVISFRSAYGGTQSLLGVTPDLTTMAKIIGGGFPVGAVGGTAEVMGVFDPSERYPRAPHGGTFNANPITMVAGVAAMQKMTPQEYERLDRLGELLREGLAESLDGARVRGQVTGMGSLFTVHLHDRPIHDYRSSLATAEEAARTSAIYRAMHAAGVVTAPYLAGCLSTPMTETEIGTIVATFQRALGETSEE
jgi:glutamate-1-semialdehyde 2,1-aminomutase